MMVPNGPHSGSRHSIQAVVVCHGGWEGDLVYAVKIPIGQAREDTAVDEILEPGSWAQ